MLQNAYFLAKIGADTAKNEQHFAEILPKIGNYPTGPPAPRRPVRCPAAQPSRALQRVALLRLFGRHPRWPLERQHRRRSTYFFYPASSRVLRFLSRAFNVALTENFTFENCCSPEGRREPRPTFGFFANPASRLGSQMRAAPARMSEDAEAAARQRWLQSQPDAGTWGRKGSQSQPARSLDLRLQSEHRYPGNDQPAMTS